MLQEMIIILIIAAIICAIAVFSIPSFILAMISPFAVKAKSKEDNEIGSLSGRISSLSTIGSIVGTFLMGFVLIPNIPLKIVYNTTKGINYIRLMAPICLLYYIQSPLTAGLQAMGKAKDGMTGTLLGVSVKLIVLIIGCNIRIGMMGLIASIIINIIVVTIYDYRKISKYLK